MHRPVAKPHIRLYIGGNALDPLDKLESRSVYILREAYAAFGNLCMLWSIGKDSTVLLWLARKAFFGHVPFPLVHIDTHFKIPEMITYRDNLARQYGLYMLYGENREALDSKQTYPDGAIGRVECCRLLKTQALTHTLDGSWPRYRLNLETGAYELDANREPYTGVIVGVRSDEEGSRSKERYFSSRDKNNDWNLEDQPPEFWNQYKTDFAPGTHVRIHPLLDWTELNIWEYIEREKIPTVSLYYDQGDGRRYRSLGCAPCTAPIHSKSKNPADIIEELRAGALSGIAERSGRAQDKEDGGGLETLRRDGYM
jgi:sulfate adenylyltransferase subunit 2